MKSRSRRILVDHKLSLDLKPATIRFSFERGVVKDDYQMLTIHSASCITPTETRDVLILQGGDKRRRREVTQRSKVQGLRVDPKDTSSAGQFTMEIDIRQGTTYR